MTQDELYNKVSYLPLYCMFCEQRLSFIEADAVYKWIRCSNENIHSNEKMILGYPLTIGKNPYYDPSLYNSDENDFYIRATKNTEVIDLSFIINDYSVSFKFLDTNHCTIDEGTHTNLLIYYDEEHIPALETIVELQELLPIPRTKEEVYKVFHKMKNLIPYR